MTILLVVFEQDSHKNINLLGKHAYIFDKVPEWTCSVAPFDPSVETSKVPILDGAVAYNYPYSHKNYILITRNPLRIPTIDHNLLSPFIIREAGLIVNETTKIHCKDPSRTDYAIIGDEYNLVFQLQLN